MLAHVTTRAGYCMGGRSFSATCTLDRSKALLIIAAFFSKCSIISFTTLQQQWQSKPALHGASRQRALIRVRARWEIGPNQEKNWTAAESEKKKNTNTHTHIHTPHPQSAIPTGCESIVFRGYRVHGWPDRCLNGTFCYKKKMGKKKKKKIRRKKAPVKKKWKKNAHVLPPSRK